MSDFLRRYREITTNFNKDNISHSICLLHLYKNLQFTEYNEEYSLIINNIYSALDTTNEEVNLQYSCS